MIMEILPEGIQLPAKLAARQEIHWESSECVQQGKQITKLAKQWFLEMGESFFTCVATGDALQASSSAQVGKCGGLVYKCRNSQDATKFIYRCIICGTYNYHCTQHLESFYNFAIYKKHMKGAHAENQELQNNLSAPALYFDYYGKLFKDLPSLFAQIVQQYVVDYYDRMEREAIGGQDDLFYSTDTDLFVPPPLPNLIDNDDDYDYSDVEDGREDFEEDGEFLLREGTFFNRIDGTVEEDEINSTRTEYLRTRERSTVLNSAKIPFFIEGALLLMANVTGTIAREPLEDCETTFYLNAKSFATRLEREKNFAVLENKFKNTGPYKHLAERNIHYLIATGVFTKQNYPNISKAFLPGYNEVITAQYKNMDIRIQNNMLQVKEQNDTEFDTISFFHGSCINSTPKLVDLPDTASKFIKFENQKNDIRLDFIPQQELQTGLFYTSCFDYIIELIQDPSLQWYFTDRFDEANYANTNIFSFTQCKKYHQIFQRQTMHHSALPIVFGIYWDESRTLLFDNNEKRNFVYIFPLNVSTHQRRSTDYWRCISVINPTGPSNQLELIKARVNEELERAQLFVSYFGKLKAKFAFSLSLSQIRGDEEMLNDSVSMRNNSAVHACRKCLELYSQLTIDIDLRLQTKPRTKELADYLLYRFENSATPTIEANNIAKYTSFLIERYQQNQFRLTRNFDIFVDSVSCLMHMIRLGIYNTKLFPMIYVYLTRASVFDQFCTALHSITFVPAVRHFNFYHYSKFQGEQSYVAAMTIPLILRDFMDAELADIIVMMFIICRCIENPVMRLMKKREILQHAMAWIDHCREKFGNCIFVTYPKLHLLLEELIEELLVNIAEYSCQTGEAMHAEMKAFKVETGHKNDMYILRKQSQASILRIYNKIFEHDPFTYFNHNYKYLNKWIINNYIFSISKLEVFSLKSQSNLRWVALKKIICDTHQFKNHQCVQYGQSQYGELQSIICINSDAGAEIVIAVIAPYLPTTTNTLIGMETLNLQYHFT